MIPADRLLLLDTNILVHLIRSKELGQRIARDYQIPQRSERPLVCVVTVGEALALAEKLSWGAAKKSKLDDLLHELVIVDIDSPSVLRKYAEIDAFLTAKGLPIGQNDMWIAAAAACANAVLLTSDKDFDRLYPQFVEREYVAP